jgi:hypothetical protein
MIEVVLFIISFLCLILSVTAMRACLKLMDRVEAIEDFLIKKG